MKMEMRRSQALLAFLLSVFFSAVPRLSAFVTPPASNSRPSSSFGIALAATPLINEWEIKAGRVYGVVQNHPTIPNGDVITTSRLATDVKNLKDNQLVRTESGSQYRLGKGKFDNITNNGAKEPQAMMTAKKPEPIQKMQLSAADRAKYNLNGKSVGDGAYLLSGQKLKSTSVRSEIYYAYKADKNGLPTEPRLTVKISSNVQSLARENDAYNKVTSGLFYRDNFVKKLDYLSEAQGNKGSFKNCGVLVLESGERTLRALCDARRNKGLEGKAMRQAAVAVVQCIQAMQSCGLVWTDIKAENFVIVSDTLGEGSIEGIKAIDLESAVKVGGSPIDYSPEATPPEFAQAIAKGLGPDFVVNYEYDSWSYGMLLYELAVGKSYWGGKNDNAIVKILEDPKFEVDVSVVQDDNLRDLVAKCLQTDPKKRLRITQILFHPYFLKTGFGPISF